MSAKLEPHQAAQHFFRSLMQSQCNVCWALFTKKSQDVFLKWTVDDIYQRHPEAAKASKIGASEVRLMFEKNDTSLMKSFWKYFFYISNANELFRFGYFNLVEIAGSKAKVVVNLQYPDGRTAETYLDLFQERGEWRFGYIESGLNF